MGDFERFAERLTDFHARCCEAARVEIENSAAIAKALAWLDIVTSPNSTKEERAEAIGKALYFAEIGGYFSRHYDAAKDFSLLADAEAESG